MKKDVSFAPGYYVTDQGEVYSKNYNRRIGVDRKLKPEIANNGYLRYTIWVKGKRTRFLAHRLIAIVLIENPKNLKYVNHKNSIRTDNRVDNLEWCTMSDNIKHGYSDGFLIPTQGELHGNHILTEQQVLRVRKMYVPRKFSQEKVAELFGVKRGCIKDIVERKTWKHI